MSKWLQIGTPSFLSLSTHSPASRLSGSSPPSQVTVGSRSDALFRLVLRVCQEYFLDGGMKRMLEKDEKNARLAAVRAAVSLSAQPSTPLPR